MKTWQESGYDWEITADGSPTLRKVGGGESMHHSGGALEETLMIYGEPLRESFARLERPLIFSLGLGLGYVELVAAADSVRSGKSFEMLTLELIPELVETFILGLRGRLAAGTVLDGFNEVTRRVSEARGVPPAELHRALVEAYDAGRWRIGGALTPETIPAERFTTVLYDAYSAKTCPDLWTQEFLESFLGRCCEPDCLFSTYACTGILKRALKGAGFEMVQRDGFKGKRHSTLGRRGVFAGAALPARDDASASSWPF